MSDLVGNSKERFSNDAAQLSVEQIRRVFDDNKIICSFFSDNLQYVVRAKQNGLIKVILISIHNLGN